MGWTGPTADLQCVRLRHDCCTVVLSAGELAKLYTILSACTYVHMYICRLCRSCT